MLPRSGNQIRILCVLIALLAAPLSHALPAASWSGVLTDDAGKPVSQAIVKLHATSPGPDYTATTAPDGKFVFAEIALGTYEVSVKTAGKTWEAATPIVVKDAATLTSALQFSPDGQELRVILAPTLAPREKASASGGGHISSAEVSSLPLNERDFSKLLLLAAGTMTDTNGAANFTQQFAVNGQRGGASVFAMDGADTSDPELGGATFSNFNVDAIQEVQSSSGVMPAEIGHGAAGFNTLISKSGTNDVHGSAFEFVRNAAFDARNFFDHQSAVEPRRIPPFERNEFGVTNGGPLFLPHVYDGRSKTFYFAEYQGFRQVLGTTQVFPVPTAAERQGIDTTAFPGDTLTVPVNAAIA